MRASKADLGVLGSGMAAARVERIIERRREGCIVISVFVVCGGEVLRRAARMIDRKK